MKKTAIFLATAALMGLTACGDKRFEASETIFKKSIERFNSGQNVCLPLNLDVQLPNGEAARVHNVLGEPVIKIAIRNQDDKRINRVAQEQMDILLDQGFYRKEKAKKADAAPKDPATPNIQMSEYTLTAQGEKQVKASPHGPLFCLGTQKIKKVNWFTAPTPANGMTLSKVSYQVELKPERWAVKLIEAGGESWQPLQQERSEMTTLVQTNDGWRDLREVH